MASFCEAQSDRQPEQWLQAGYADRVLSRDYPVDSDLGPGRARLTAPQIESAEAGKYPIVSSWGYQAALTVSATVVCSVGAAVQMADLPAVSQAISGASSGPAERLNNPADGAADSAVTLPPVEASSGSPTVSFSPDTCKDSTCKGLAFVEARLPQLQAQVRETRAQMQVFQEKHTAQNLQTHRSILAYRATDLAKQQAELELRAHQLNQQAQNLAAALALQPDEVTQVVNLLQTDANYQAQLQQLQAIEQKIATEYSTPDLSGEGLSAAYAEYYEAESQLRREAQAVLADYVAAAGATSADPLWQENSYQYSLQQLIDLAHQRQMLAVEQNTLAVTEAQLTERRTELAALLRQYAALQRQLEDQNQVLQQYVAERQELQNELARVEASRRQNT